MTRGTFLGLRADVVTAISAVVVSIVVSRGLGADDRGIFFLAFTAAVLLALVGDLGVSTAGIVFASRKELEFGQLHGVVLGAALGAGLLAAALLLPAEDFWTSEILKGVSSTMMILLCAGIAPLVYAQALGAALTGLGRIPAVSWIRIGVQIAIPAALFPAVLITHDPAWTLAGWLVVTVGHAVTVGVYATRTVARPRFPRSESWRKVLSFGFRGWIGTISARGFLRLDLFVLGARTGPRQVGIYSLSSTFAERIALLGTAVYGATAGPIGSGSQAEAARLVARVVRILVLVLLPAAAVAAVLAFPAFPLVFGDDFEEAALPFALLLPGTVCLTLWYPVSLFIVSSLRRPGTTTVIQCLALAASIPLYIAAIDAEGMEGAAVASSLVYGSVFAAGVAVAARAGGLRVAELVPRAADLSDLRGLAARVLRRG